MQAPSLAWDTDNVFGTDAHHVVLAGQLPPGEENTVHAPNSTGAEMDMDLTFAMDLGSPTAADAGALSARAAGVESNALTCGIITGLSQNPLHSTAKPAVTAC